MSVHFLCHFALLEKWVCKDLYPAQWEMKIGACPIGISVAKGLTPLQISGSVICDKCKNHNWVGHFCRRASRGGKLVASTNNEGWFDDISVILMYMQVCVWRIMIHGVLCDAWWHKVRLASPHKM